MPQAVRLEYRYQHWLHHRHQMRTSQAKNARKFYNAYRMRLATRLCISGQSATFAILGSWRKLASIAEVKPSVIHSKINIDNGTNIDLKIQKVWRF
jgi:hypothetical protein